MADVKIDRLVIFGVGLIGGSFAVALRKAGAVRHIIGIGRGRENIEQALTMGVIDQGLWDTGGEHLRAVVQDADLILLATPISSIKVTIAHLVPYLTAKTIVTDAGSTKQDIIEVARTSMSTSQLAKFIPAHPIAGAEHSGVAAAKTDLFQGKKLVLTPLPETDAASVEIVSKLWQVCGATIVEMKAHEHDEIFAMVSHLPHVLAYALVDMVANEANADRLFEFAASGFRDFTRIASSSPEMWAQICTGNRAALLQSLQKYRNQLDKLIKYVEDAHWDKVEATFKNARDKRNEWLKHIEQ